MPLETLATAASKDCGKQPLTMTVPIEKPGKPIQKNGELPFS